MEGSLVRRCVHLKKGLGCGDRVQGEAALNEGA